MLAIERPENFNAENFNHIDTVKAERSGGHDNGDLYYSIDRTKYGLNRVPLIAGYYANGDYFFRVVDIRYNEYTVLVFEQSN